MRNRGRKAPNPLTKTFESNGPDVKVRGTAQHIAEKYTQLSRDAQASGDRVAAENYLQHAEHYIRIILSAQAQFQQNFGFPRQFDDEQDDLGEDGGYGVQDYSAPQPTARFPQIDEDGQPILPQRAPQEGRSHDSRSHEPRLHDGRSHDGRSHDGRSQDGRSQDGRSQEPRNAERFERPDRQERRERFTRRREAAASRYTQGGQGEDLTAAQQPSLPAFLTTPVRTVSDSDDDQPVIVAREPRQPEAEPASLPIGVTEDSGDTAKPETRVRRRRTVASTVDNEAAADDTGTENSAEAPVRKTRVTRTRRKSVDDVSVAE